MREATEDKPFQICDRSILVLQSQVQIYLIILGKSFFFYLFAVFMFPKVLRNKSFPHMAFYSSSVLISVCPRRKGN